MDNQVWLLYGLGNKDTKYSHTYHNLGWLFLDEILKTKKIKTTWQEVCHNQFCVTKLKDISSDKEISVVLAKRTGYMNESGEGLSVLLRYLKTDICHLIVIQDDTDLPLGSYKFSWDKNTAGHKGILSINQNLKTKAYWRLRLGSRPSLINIKAMDFVLKRISQEKLSELEKIFDLAYQELLKQIASMKKTDH
jgi:PTH1 family peptidyl-tRNA hydrolase